MDKNKEHYFPETLFQINLVANLNKKIVPEIRKRSAKNEK